MGPGRYDSVTSSLCPLCEGLPVVRVLWARGRCFGVAAPVEDTQQDSRAAADNFLSNGEGVSLIFSTMNTNGEVSGGVSADTFLQKACCVDSMGKLAWTHGMRSETLWFLLWLPGNQSTFTARLAFIIEAPSYVPCVLPQPTTSPLTRSMLAVRL